MFARRLVHNDVTDLRNLLQRGIAHFRDTQDKGDILARQRMIGVNRNLIILYMGYPEVKHLAIVALSIQLGANVAQLFRSVVYLIRKHQVWIALAKSFAGQKVHFYFFIYRQTFEGLFNLAK